MVIEMVKTLSGPLSQQQNPNGLEPTRKPQLDLLEREEVKAKRPSMWNIVFYNDDYTSMEFVIFVLTRVFHRSTEDALALTFAVYTEVRVSRAAIPSRLLNRSNAKSC